MKSETPSVDYVLEVDMVGRAEWTAALQEFDDATIYQTWSYGAIRWGEHKLSHLILKSQGKIVAIAQCAIRRVPGLYAGIAYIPWGPVWHRRGLPGDPAIFKRMLGALEKEYADRRGLLLRIAPTDLNGDTDELRKILNQNGFALNSSRPIHRTLVMDLTFSLENLRKGLKRQWRQNLQHAEGCGLTVIEGTGDDLYSMFLDLYNRMLSRKDFEPGVDAGELGRIQKDLPEAFKMKTMICQFEGRPVAAIVVSMIGSMAICLLAATDEEALRLRAAYLLQWRMIEWLKGVGARAYDLGGINPEKNPGGYQYKTGLSGKYGRDVLYLGQFEKSNNARSSILVNVGERLDKVYKKLKGKVIL